MNLHFVDLRNDDVLEDITYFNNRQIGDIIKSSLSYC